MSIKVGKILPSTLLRKRSNNSKENTLYEAPREMVTFIRTL
ncbi:TPA: hypothetical protein ACGW3F_004196 [Bacillus paranthracis]